MSDHKRIALIHAVTAAMPPIATAFAENWPEANCVNVLEDSLARDRDAAGALTPDLVERIGRLAQYGAGIGSQGVLFTCSAFGAAIEAAAAALHIPVLKPNEAMFETAIENGERIAMLYTFAPALAGMAAEFEAQAKARARKVQLMPIHVEGAVAAIRAGAVAEHNALVAQAAAAVRDVDVVMLAHFSTAEARHAVAAVTDLPVLTAPAAAVTRLRELVE